MIRAITRPSTAKCTLPAYVSFLLSEPTMISCCRLAEIKAISHDSVNRFLNREDYEPIDLFDEVKPTPNECTCEEKEFKTVTVPESSP